MHPRDENVIGFAMASNPVVVMTEDMEDGGLTAKLFNEGMLEVESSVSVSLQIEKISNLKLSASPDRAVYKVTAYKSNALTKESCGSGAVYIDYEGKFILPNGRGISMRD